MDLDEAPEQQCHFTFLLIDQNPEDVSLIRTLFERGGDCQVHAVADCQLAFDYLTGEGLYADRTLYPIPSLILLDLTRQSFEFLQWLRQGAAPRLRSLPVALLSTTATPDDVEITRRLGVNSWLLKPEKALAA